MTPSGDGRVPEHSGYPNEAVNISHPPGQMQIALAGLVIGLVLMGIQLWLLTVSLDLYLSGEGGQIWGLAVVSGVIFLGGLVMIWLLNRRFRVGGMPR